MTLGEAVVGETVVVIVDPHDGKVDKWPVRAVKAAKRSGRSRAAGKRKYQHPRAAFSFKRQVIPPLAGLLVTAAVLLAINGQWLYAQWHYYFHHPSAAVATAEAAPEPASSSSAAAIDDTKSPDPAAGPLIHIPAIDVNAPLVTTVGTAEWQIQLGLRQGVVHYAASAAPGQPGNAVFFGHSSGQPWAPGGYKFVFTLLGKVVPGDAVQIDYNGTRYTYQVTDSQVVVPTDVSVLDQKGDSPTLTLITCTPVGTSLKRLVVHAKLLRPLPAGAAAPRAAAKSATPAVLPGN